MLEDIFSTRWMKLIKLLCSFYDYEEMGVGEKNRKQLCRNHFPAKQKKHSVVNSMALGGTWVVLLVKRPVLDFGSCTISGL